MPPEVIIFFVGVITGWLIAILGMLVGGRK
jgi:FKBP-type peptidyl-prolyl cis-trans isomerase